MALPQYNISYHPRRFPLVRGENWTIVTFDYRKRRLKRGCEGQLLYRTLAIFSADLMVINNC